MTRIEQAQKGIVTDEMKAVALAEGIGAEKFASDIAQGVSVITRNLIHDIKLLVSERGSARRLMQISVLRKTGYPLMKRSRSLRFW